MPLQNAVRSDGKGDGGIIVLSISVKDRGDMHERPISGYRVTRFGGKGHADGDVVWSRWVPSAGAAASPGVALLSPGRDSISAIPSRPWLEPNAARFSVERVAPARGVLV